MTRLIVHSARISYGSPDRLDVTRKGSGRRPKPKSARRASAGHGSSPLLGHRSAGAVGSIARRGRDRAPQRDAIAQAEDRPPTGRKAAGLGLLRRTDREASSALLGRSTDRAAAPCSALRGASVNRVQRFRRAILLLLDEEGMSLDDVQRVLRPCGPNERELQHDLDIAFETARVSSRPTGQT